MKRTLMQTYVRGSVEAVALYQKAFGTELGFHVKSPDGTYYHAELDVFGQILAVAEKSDATITGDTMQFCLHFDFGDEDTVKRAYELLVEGGQVLVPLGPCDFSPYASDFIDRFGVRWCLFIA